MPTPATIRKRLGRYAFTLHSWFGLITGVFLLLLGLSGSVLVFKKELDRALNGEQLAVQPRGAALPVDSLYRMLAYRYPNLRGIGLVDFPDRPDQCYEFRLYGNDGNPHTYDLYLVNVDPYTGAILREGSYRDLSASFLHWLLQFHFSFQWGVVGVILTAAFGLTMLLSIVTGTVVYRKHVLNVLLFRERIRFDNWRRASSGLHRVVGVWSLLLNVVIFFTGFWLNRFGFDRSYWNSQTKPAQANVLFTASVDEMLRAAQSVQPIRVKYVYMPTKANDEVRVYGEDLTTGSLFGEFATKISFDPVTGAVKRIKDRQNASWGEKLEAMVGPLHYGTFGGLLTKILYVIVGLTPGLLALTGFALWWRRKRPQTKTIKRQSGPPKPVIISNV